MQIRLLQLWVGKTFSGLGIALPFLVGRGRVGVFLVSASSQMPSVQNNPYTRVGFWGQHAVNPFRDSLRKETRVKISCVQKGIKFHPRV